MQHNADYVLSRRSGRLFSYNQPHIFHAFAVFDAGGNDVNAGSVDTAVTENVGELGNIFFDTVKHSCKQMAQVVRKNFLRIDTRTFAKAFHFPPDIRTT